jgi:integrase
MACITTKHGKLAIDYYDANKKRHTLKFDGTKEQAQIRLGEILKGGKQAVNTKTNFKDYGQWWLENCAKGDIKESTYEEYERALKNHLYPVFGSRPMSKLTRKEMKEFVTRKRGKGLSRSSIRNIFAPMRAMFNQLIEDGELNFNPAANLGKLNKKKDRDAEDIDEVREENVYDMGQVDTALDKAKEKKPGYHPVFATAFLSGIRMGEQIGLRAMDVDFKSHVIRVRKNYYRKRITTPKGNRLRNVDMEPVLEEILAPLIANKKAAALREEIKKPAGERRKTEKVIREVMEGYLFTTPIGTRLDPSNLRRAFHSVLEEAELKKIRYHDMRHTYASNLLKAGRGLDEVMRLLGHSSIQITVDTYGHFLPQKERQATLTDAMAAARKEKQTA